jgi:hypothetical protein
MSVACKNGIRPSTLVYGWHGDSDVLVCQFILTYGWHGGCDGLIGPSTLSYGCHGGRVQEWQESIHFGVWGGMEVDM